MKASLWGNLCYYKYFFKNELRLYRFANLLLIPLILNLSACIVFTQNSEQKEGIKRVSLKILDLKYRKKHPLHLASAENDLHKVSLLLQEGVTVNSQR